MVPIMPRGFKQDTPQVCVPCFGNRSTPAPGPAGMLGRHKAHESHDPRRARKAPRIAELGGHGEGGQVTYPRKHRNRRTGSAKGSLVKYVRTSSSTAVNRAETS